MKTLKIKCVGRITNEKAIEKIRKKRNLWKNLKRRAQIIRQVNETREID